MFKDCQKSLLIVLFLCTLPSIYAMENRNTSEKSLSTSHSEDFINKKFYNAAITAINNKFSKKEDLEIIKKCLDDGADIDFPLTKHKVTLLMFAVNFKKGDLVDYLLQRKADVNFCAPHNGLSLLFNLFEVTPKSEKIDLQIMGSLLKYRANPDGKRTWKNQDTPLSYTIWNGYKDAARLLIDYKADVNLKNPDCAPLQLAILKKDFDAIKALREAGAVLHNIDPKNSTALHYMIVNKKDEIKNFIKHISFNVYNKNQNELFKKTITGTLLTFKKLNELPGFPQISKDLQFYIVSKLPMACLGNIEICDALLKKNHDPVLPEVYKHIKLLKKTSKIQNKDNSTALHLLHHNYAQNQSHIKNVEKFFHPNLIEKDWEDFMKVYPNTSLVSEDNVAGIVYDNYLSLINKK